MQPIRPEQVLTAKAELGEAELARQIRAELADLQTKAELAEEAGRTLLAMAELAEAALRAGLAAAEGRIKARLALLEQASLAATAALELLARQMLVMAWLLVEAVEALKAARAATAHEVRCGSPYHKPLFSHGILAYWRRAMSENPVKFDNTVNLGQIITAVSMVLSLVAAYFLIKSDIRNHEDRIVRVEQSVGEQNRINVETSNRLGEIKTGVAVIQDRLERNAVGNPK